MRRREYLKKSAALTVAGLGAADVWAQQAAPTAQGMADVGDFARRPLMERVALSPDGKRLAAVINNSVQSILITRPVNGGGVQVVMGTDNLESSFNWFRWVNNDRLILSLRFPSRRAVGYVGTVATMESRLLAVNADGSKPINLVKDRTAAGPLLWAVQQDRVVDWLADDGKHVLLQLPEPDYGGYAVYKVNVETAERRHYSGVRENVFAWLTDQSHRVRIGIARSEKSQTSIWVCNPDGSNWRVLSEFGPFASSGIELLGFGLDPNLLYVYAPHQGLQAVHVIDLRDPKLEPKLKLSHPRFDLEGALIRDAKGEAVGIRETSLGDSSAYYWDEGFKLWQKDIDEALPGRHNMILSSAGDSLGPYILRSSEKGRPARYYVGERGDNPKLRELAATYPELDKRSLGIKQEVKFAARDGLELHGYLSLPPAGKEKDLPMVLFPHGGPQLSTGPEFDEWVAFMNDRGYAVLEVNYRGSTGYGQKFMEAGLRRWGLEMQDDLTDSVAEFVKRGVADPKRVAIVGASYGGYAALMGAVKTPTLFQGAFAFAGVSDLIAMIEEDLAYSWGRREAIRKQIGDASDDKERLLATSPRFHVDKIQVPIFLIHGTHDRQVEYQQSVWMAEALKKAGKPHEFVTLDKGDHQLSHQPYRTQLFTALEGFLLKTLGPGDRSAAAA